MASGTDYWSGYATVPIGGGNPYYQCAGCFVSDPEINGDIDKHGYGCTEVEKYLKERRIEELEERVEALEKRMLIGGEALEALQEKIENAQQAASETHSSWKHRCYAIMAALGIDYGEVEEPDELKDIRIKRLEDENFDLLQEIIGLRIELNEMRDERNQARAHASYLAEHNDYEPERW